MRLSILFAILSLAVPLSAATLFFEDFEGYSTAAPLAGQGGWTDNHTGYWQMYPQTGSHLPSTVLDGRYFPGTLGGIDFAKHLLPSALDPSLITVLSFDAFAVSTAPASTNTGVALGDVWASPTLYVDWEIQNAAGKGWTFDARWLSGNPANSWSLDLPSLLDNYDRLAHFQIIVDPSAGEFYGTYDLGSGVAGQTPHFTLTADVALINSVSMYTSYRNPSPPELGAEFDNILLDESPEPATVWLTLAAATTLWLRSRRRARSRPAAGATGACWG